LKIDDKCDILVLAKCRYCHQEIYFIHQSFKIFYCPQHGLLFQESYIIYVVKKTNKKESDFVTVNISNEDQTKKKCRECPFTIRSNKCIHIWCPYAHSLIELELFKFLHENKITIQLLALHQQHQREGTNFINIKN
jgi:hypothetical protein